MLLQLRLPLETRRLRGPLQVAKRGPVTCRPNDELDVTGQNAKTIEGSWLPEFSMPCDVNPYLRPPPMWVSVIQRIPPGSGYPGYRYLGYLGLSPGSAAAAARLGLPWGSSMLEAAPPCACFKP